MGTESSPTLAPFTDMENQLSAYTSALNMTVPGAIGLPVAVVEVTAGRFAFLLVVDFAETGDNAINNDATPIPMVIAQ